MCPKHDTFLLDIIIIFIYKQRCICEGVYPHRSSVCFGNSGCCCSTRMVKHGRLFPRLHMQQSAKSIKMDMMMLRKIAVETNRETYDSSIMEGVVLRQVLEVVLGNWPWRQVWALRYGISFQKTASMITPMTIKAKRFAPSPRTAIALPRMCLEQWGVLQEPILEQCQQQRFYCLFSKRLGRNPSTDFLKVGLLRSQYTTWKRHATKNEITVQLASSGMVRIFLMKPIIIKTKLVYPQVVVCNESKKSIYDGNAAKKRFYSS